jgi:hypothetical protein
VLQRSYIRYRPQAILDDDDESDLREKIEATAEDLDDATARRIEAYVRVGREEQQRQLATVRERLMKQLEDGEATSDLEDEAGPETEGERA